MNAAIQTVVLGAAGYVGGELLRLIAAHPDFELAAAVSSSSSGKPVAAVFPQLGHAYRDRRFSAPQHWLDNIGNGSRLAVFSAAPHGASAALITQMLDEAAANKLQVHVVDSSADFRYTSQDDYEAVYGTVHGAPALLPAFHCSVPEHAGTIEHAHVGHPGCFATAALLATVPLLQSGLTEPEVFIAGTTGSTGSGRSPQAGTHHPERHSNLYAYKPLAHRHSPEIARLTEAATGRATRVHFVPHSGPFARGIHATVQARLSSPASVEQLRELYADAYSNSPFVQLVEGTPRLKNVVASNFCHIGVAADDGAVVVMSAIDNLVKGAAGGAVQWMNRLWGLPEHTGLLAAPPGWV